MAKLAFLTFVLLREPWGHPQVQGFVNRIPGSFAAADASLGFVDRAGLGPEEWGESVYPAFLAPEHQERVARTLSLWDDLESVYAFAYSGVHAEALKGRKEWVEEPAAPTYVAWWVADGHRPDWAEASARQEHLHAHGATPTAFHFKAAFGPDGSPMPLDHARVKTLLQR